MHGKRKAEGNQSVRRTVLLAIGGVSLLWLCLYLSLSRVSEDALEGRMSYTGGMSTEEFNAKRLISFSTIEEGTEAEWLPVLRHGKVIRIEDIDAETGGLASKYKVVFESGHQALAKYAEPYRFIDSVWQEETILNAQLGDSLYPRRAGRKLQAWPEVAASAVARQIMPNRKIPIAMRQFSSKDWYSCVGCSSWYAYFKYLLPEHTVYVSVSAWIDRVRTTQPSTDYLKLLAKPLADGTKPTYAPEQAGLISDTIVFDFLVDDHDRLKGHNWVSDGHNNLLLWDSGLSFNHGPLGRTSCMDLLCGPDKWKEFGQEYFRLSKRDKCQKICKFRKVTIDRLKEVGPGAPEDQKLGYLVKQELAKETAPVFAFNEYYPYSVRYPKMKFIEDDFYMGLDQRVARFLSYVDECITDYGESFVIDGTMESSRWRSDRPRKPIETLP